ncbi:MAG: carbonic anhydrase, partial [Myxococcota bacterium]
MEAWKRLLLENKAWAQDRASRPREADEVEKPSFLWIGPSDARVPAEQITGAGPGELIVHRNVANLVLHTDPNVSAVIELAVRMIGVEHVIVCGHHDCHGIRAAMEREPSGMLNPWLAHVRDTWYAHRDELRMHDAVGAERRLVELNVFQQVQNLTRTE